METGHSKNQSAVDAFSDRMGVRTRSDQARAWLLPAVFFLLICNICTLLAYIQQLDRNRRQSRAPLPIEFSAAGDQVWMLNAGESVVLQQSQARRQDAVAGYQNLDESMSSAPIAVAEESVSEMLNSSESKLSPQQELDDLRAKLRAAEGEVAYLGLEKTRLENVQMTLDGMLRESRWKVLNSTNTAASKTAKQAKMRAPDTHRMLMVPIPPGTFMMGSEDGDPDEKPMHQVELTKPFWISAHEVRIVSILNWLNSPGVIREEGWIELRSAQTQCPIKWNGEAYVLNTQSQYGQSQNQPMVYISQKGAKAFCNWLTSQSNNGYKYRLPTEAEWEYAARAGSTTRYPLRDVLDQFATNCSHGPSVTEDCGRYCPNAWGLYDTVGNVSEWCADWYAPDYYSSSPAQNPQGPPEAPEVVVRSGNWVGLEFGARSTDRNHFHPDALWQVLGFRVVAELK